MLKTTAIIFSVFIFHSISFSQVDVNNVLKEIKECNCNEVVMVGSRIEKRYTGAWFTSAEVKDGMLQFSKGTNIHKWNPDQIIFIENTGNYIRIYLN